MKPMAGQAERGFTLIELLVAMSMLLLIVVIIGMFFQRASVAWNTGSRRAETLLIGRAVADFMAQEMAMAIPPDVEASGQSATFLVFGDANASLRSTQTVAYALNSGTVTRNGIDMCDGVFGLEFTKEPSVDANPMPLWVDIKVTVTNETGTNVFRSRATFPNRGRDG